MKKSTDLWCWFHGATTHRGVVLSENNCQLQCPTLALCHWDPSEPPACTSPCPSDALGPEGCKGIDGWQYSCRRCGSGDQEPGMMSLGHCQSRGAVTMSHVCHVVSGGSRSPTNHPWSWSSSHPLGTTAQEQHGFSSLCCLELFYQRAIQGSSPRGLDQLSQGSPQGSKNKPFLIRMVHALWLISCCLDARPVLGDLKIEAWLCLSTDSAQYCDTAFLPHCV